MTAQITDTFLFKGKPYELIGITGKDLFSSQNFGIKAEFIDTGCWRGFYSTYEVIDKGIFLKKNDNIPKYCKSTIIAII